MKNRNLHFYIPLGVGVATTSLVLLGLSQYWFGISHDEVMMFCERVHPGFIKQPVNTFSNFGFIAAGVYIGWLSYKNDFAARNLMTTTSFYPVSFACIVVLLGPGSMAQHGSNTSFGGFFDLLSMFQISSFTFFYAVKRAIRLSDRAFIAMFTVIVAISAWVNTQPFNLWTPYLTMGDYIFASQLILTIPIELYILHHNRTGSKVARGIASIVDMCVAVFIWSISLWEDSWFCDPDSLIQGHAIWHLLNALAAYILFMFYVTEHDEEWIPGELGESKLSMLIV